MIKPAFPSNGMEPVFGGKLGPDERARLMTRITEARMNSPARSC